MGLSVRARAWTALFAPPAVWFLFEQGLAHVVHVRCDRANLIGALWGGASLLACGAAALIAHRLARRGGRAAYPWLCRVALIGAGVFALAIALQTLAALMVPACLR